MAESFGADPERYDRVRPAYPSQMVDAILAEAPGSDVLDVGCGTGIASRPFRDAQCDVTGVEPDPRMADFARGQGFAVDVAQFEAWDRAGRTFDVLISGTTWHWIDPPVGALRAAEALRPRGVFAAFWNVHHPPQPLAESFDAAYGRISRGSPFARHGGDWHQRILNRTSRGLTDSGAFDTPQVRRYPWQQTYTREQWLEVVPTFGGHELLDTEQAAQLLDDVGGAVDAIGGSFTMSYETLLITATRT